MDPFNSKDKLNKRDLVAREDAFKKATKYIDNAAKGGGALSFHRFFGGAQNV